jgi:hypothetical protein
MEEPQQLLGASILLIKGMLFYFHMKKCKTENPNISLIILDSNLYFLEKNSVIPKPQIPSTPGPDYDL